MLAVAACGDDVGGFLERCAIADGSADQRGDCEEGLTCFASRCSKRCQEDGDCAHPSREAVCTAWRVNATTGLYSGYCGSPPEAN
jgi:hypothetical protein